MNSTSIIPAPPDHAQRLLSICLPPGQLGGSILGDLRQDYAEVARSRSPGAARLWYWYHVLSIGLPFLRTRIFRSLAGSQAKSSRPKGGFFMRSLARDVQTGWRSLRRSPMTAFLATLMIALGVGAATAMFSIVHSVLLTPLPFSEPDRLVSMIGLTPEDGVRHPFTVADFRDLRDQAASFSGIGARWSNTAGLRGEEGSQEVQVGWVTPNYFEVLDIAPLAGRTLRPAEMDAVMLGNAIWQKRFGSDRGIVGRSVILGGTPFRVVGILPPEVDPNIPTLDGTLEGNEIWRLMREEWLRGDNRVLAWLRVAGRLKPGVELPQAQAELDAIADRIAASSPKRSPGEIRFIAWTVQEHLVQNARPYLSALMAAVCFMLLVACANVANLLLARGQAKRPELAVRTALGAGRADLLRQLLAEGLLIAAIGGMGGILLSLAVVSAAPAFLPANLPRLESIQVSWPVLLFALLASFASAMLSGLVPALRSTRLAPAQALGGRTGSMGRTPRRLSQALVAAEVALSLVLLAGGGLLLRNFAQLLETHPGFRSEQLLTFSLTASGKWKTQQEAANFFKVFVEHTASIPGVREAGLTNRMPLAGGVFAGNYALTEAQVDEADKPPADYRYITPGYLDAMGTRLISGRGFKDSDTGKVALVDEVMARLAWPGDDPLGKRVWTDEQLGQGDWSEVIGVVEHMRHEKFAQQGRQTIFFPVANAGRGERRYAAVRTSVPPLSIVGQLREKLILLDSGATISRLRAMDELVADSIAPNRFAMTLVGTFALVALLMSAAGLYGVVTHSVNRRTREMGIRIALGAGRTRLLRLVLGEGLKLTVLGAAAGLAASLAMTRLMSSLLFGISTADPATYAAVAALVVASGLISCYFPARRAMGADPVEALRSE